MPIRYPLTMPDEYFAGAAFSLESAVAVHRSPFTFSTEVQEHAGEMWRLRLEGMRRGRASAQPWHAFLAKLRGQRGTFVAGDPGKPTPLGSGSASTPTVNGASQTGHDLATQGWPVSTNGLLLAGDMIQIARNYVVGPNTLATSPWADQQLTPTNNSSDLVDPLGTNTATKLVPDGGATNAAVWQQYTGLAYVPGYRFGGGVWLRRLGGAGSFTGFSISVRGDASHTAPATISSVTGLTILDSAWTYFAIPPAVAPAAADRISLLIGAGGTDWATADGNVYAWGASLYSLEHDARLHIVDETFDSDSNGRGTLVISPPCRTIDNHAAIVTSSAKGLFRLASNVRGWTEAPPVRYGDMDLDAVEAL